MTLAQVAAALGVTYWRKPAPAATDSPIAPTVRAMFSSSSEPFISRSSDIPITAAG